MYWLGPTEFIAKWIMGLVYQANILLLLLFLQKHFIDIFKNKDSLNLVVKTGIKMLYSCKINCFKMISDH